MAGVIYSHCIVTLFLHNINQYTRTRIALDIMHHVTESQLVKAVREPSFSSAQIIPSKLYSYEKDQLERNGTLFFVIHIKLYCVMIYEIYCVTCQ